MVSIKKTTLIILLLFGVQIISANYMFYKKVIQVCDTYRIKVQTADMNITGKTFSLTLNSGRNNFEMVMLVGFASAGQAIIEQVNRGNNTDLPTEINVMVVMQIGPDDVIISAVASAQLTQQLANGTVETHEFMRQIKDSMQSL